MNQNPFWIGVAIAMALCGLIPSVTGLIFAVRLYTKGAEGWRTVVVSALALIGGVASAGMGFLLGCIGGLPTSIFFTVPILIISLTAPDPEKRRRRRSSYEDDYDDEDDDYDRPRRRRMRADERRDLEDERGADRDEFDRRRNRPDYY
jgi:hypothetical protein